MKRYLLAAIATLLLYPRAAVADRIHLPCDPDMALGIGTGTFEGRTSGIQFNRTQPLVFRGELRLPGLSSTCDGKKYRRHWFSRFNVYVSVVPETSSLVYENTPGIVTDDDDNPVYQTVDNCDPTAAGCEFLLDENGQKVPRTKNTLTRADLHTGMDWSGGVGLRFSIYDGQWRNWAFHVEAFGEIAGSPFYNDAEIDSLSAHLLETDLDVTKLGQEHVRADYRWWMYQVGLTIGVPLKLKRLGNKPFTPYLVVGYAGFRAKIRAKVDDDLRRDLEAVGADVNIIEEPRVISKKSPTLSLGARYDPSKYFSLETSAMFGYTGETTVYWLTGSAIFRFDLY